MNGRYRGEQHVSPRQHVVVGSPNSGGKVGSVTEEVLLTIQRQVRDARALIRLDPRLGLSLLRLAESTAGCVPSDLVEDHATFRAVLDLRNELGCCVLAAERLEEAGVERHVVVEILQRGAESAETIIGKLTVDLERC